MTDYEPLLSKAYTRKDNDEVVDLYRDWATTYDRELGDNQYVAPQHAAAAFADHVSDPATTIIDIGCGTGLVGELLAQGGFTTIDGLDISEEMLVVAETKGVYRHLFAADMTKTLDTPAAHYGTAISVGTFTHNHVGPSGLDEVLRIVKPGGIACITVNANAYVEDGYRDKFDQLVADGRCDILEEREEDYIITTGVRGRIVVLRRL